MVKEKLPPGPGPLRGLIERAEYFLDPLKFFTKAQARYGDVVHWRIFGMNLFVFNHPEHIEEVLRRQHSSFQKDEFLQGVRRVTGNGLLTSEGDLWKRQRRLIQPAFQSSQIVHYSQGMLEATIQMLTHWHPGTVVDIHEEMSRLTLDIVARALFTADVTGTAKQVGKDLEILMRYFANPMYLFPWTQKLPTIGNWRLRAAIGRLYQIIANLIVERREHPASQQDLLARLLAARDELGGEMSDTQVRDELLTLFLAGHETTALTLSYTIMLLARNPEAGAALRCELEQVLEGPAPNVGELPKLRYTEAVIKESMRLYPPAWILGREVTEECVVGGYRLPKGAQVLCAQWVAHRDARFFPDPLQFRPERWLDGSTDALPRGAYFPFGDGPRICIGQSFAMMEAVLVLALVASRYSFELIPGQKLRFVPSITLRPARGIRVKITPLAATSHPITIPPGARLDQPEKPSPIAGRQAAKVSESKDALHHLDEK